MDVDIKVPEISKQDQAKFNPVRLKTRKQIRALIRELNQKGKLTAKQAAKMKAWGKIGSLILGAIEAENLDRSDLAVILMTMEARRFLGQAKAMQDHINNLSIPVPPPPLVPVPPPPKKDAGPLGRRIKRVIPTKG